MAHTLGAADDTPHGVACAMMLPIVMDFNKEYTGEKYKAIAEAFGVDTTGMDSGNLSSGLLSMLFSSYPLMSESLPSLRNFRKLICHSCANLLK